MTRAAMILAFVGGVVVLSAQAPVDQPKFDVASVRPNTSGDGRFSMAWPKGSFSATNVELRMLVAQAYGIAGQFEMRFKIVGGPRELLAERYDIQARLPESAPEGQHFEMLRSLLADRFKLRAHTEARPTPIYALTFAREDRRLGSDLRPSTVDCNAERDRARRNGQPFTAETAPRDAKGRSVCWGNFQSGVPGAQTLTNVGPLADLVRGIQAVADRPVTDATDLSGRFEWHVVFASGANANSDLPSVFTAVQEQLGLKLEPRTSPFDVLVIDSVERPMPD
jgi:uncharacterized protein (TIGR03435 family)